MKTFSYNVLLVADHFSVNTQVHRTEAESQDSDNIIAEALENMSAYGVNPKLFGDIELLDCYDIEEMD